MTAERLGRLDPLDGAGHQTPRIQQMRRTVSAPHAIRSAAEPPNCTAIVLTERFQVRVPPGEPNIACPDRTHSYIDVEEKTLQPLPNPFWPKVLPRFRLFSLDCTGWIPVSATNSSNPTSARIFELPSKRQLGVGESKFRGAGATASGSHVLHVSAGGRVGAAWTNRPLREDSRHPGRVPIAVDHAKAAAQAPVWDSCCRARVIPF